MHPHNPQYWRVLFLFLYVLHRILRCYISGVNALCIDIDFLSLMSIFLSSSLLRFKKSVEYLVKEIGQIFTLDKIIAAEFAFEKFSCYSKVFLSYFLFYALLLLIFPGIWNLLFSECSDVVQFFLLIFFFFFIISIMNFLIRNFIAIFRLQIQILWISAHTLFILRKKLNSIYMRLLNFLVTL